MTFSSKIFVKSTALCPCQSNLVYGDCCGVLHSHQQQAKTAEQLMRSRYSAFVIENIDYIVETTAPTQQILLNRQALQVWAQQTQWLGLQVLQHKILDKQHSLVVFEAKFQGEEEEQIHDEQSLFVNIANRWYFVDPTVPLPGMKQACLCGSGKKFKHCCGGWLCNN